MHELIEKVCDEKKLHGNEGRRGVENLCKLVRILGYKDPMYFGQFAQDGAYGDLIEFLQDNSGAVEAIKEWIGDQNIMEWREALESEIPETHCQECGEPMDTDCQGEPRCTACDPCPHCNDQ